MYIGQTQIQPVEIQVDSIKWLWETLHYNNQMKIRMKLPCFIKFQRGKVATIQHFGIIVV